VRDDRGRKGEKDDRRWKEVCIKGDGRCKGVKDDRRWR